jgi:hypothetical protein
MVCPFRGLPYFTKGYKFHVPFSHKQSWGGVVAEVVFNAIIEQAFMNETFQSPKMKIESSYTPFYSSMK